MDMPILALKRPAIPRFKPDTAITKNATVSFASFPPKSFCLPLYHRYSKYATAIPERIHDKVSSGLTILYSDMGISFSTGGIPPRKSASAAMTNRTSDQRKLYVSSCSGCVHFFISMRGNSQTPPAKRVA